MPATDTKSAVRSRTKRERERTLQYYAILYTASHRLTLAIETGAADQTEHIFSEQRRFPRRAF